VSAARAGAAMDPAFLKLDLYCKGIRVPDETIVEEDGGRKVLRTRAGLGSGLELILPGDLWTNVPVTERFARESPYVLTRGSAGEYWIEREGGRVAPVRLAPRPAWYDRPTQSGKLMTRVGTLQGTYLGVYPAKVCEYWTEDVKVNCKFCSVGLNLGVDDADLKSVDEVLEVARAARRDSGITYIDFNTGHYQGDTYLDILEPYVRRIKEELGLLVGVQTPPHHDLRRYDALRAMGVNRVSFCFEIWDRDIFADVCPGKHREYGQARYLEAIRYCAGLGRRGPWSEPWVTNGEIIAGLEPAASSIAAIEWITSVGAIPTVCVFRPLQGTDYSRLAPPRTEDMVPVFRALYEACMARGLPIGCAPNVHVSLVMLPEEARSLSPRRFPLRELKRRALKRAVAFQLERRFRARDRAQSAVLEGEPSLV
jgi:sodium-dependent dicarboxylate transporter 2/3/5